VVIFVLIVGGAIAGLLGAILAIPITAAGRDVYRYLFNRLSDDESAPELPEPSQPSAENEEKSELEAEDEEAARHEPRGAPTE
jgi:hypothetical protein